MTEHDIEIDTSGLNCPLPILRTKKALVMMESGQVLHIIATDPGSVVDFHAFAAKSDNELLDANEVDGSFHFYLKKK